MLVARGADIHAVGHVRRCGGWRLCGATGRVWGAHTTHRPATACWLACREPRACTSPRSTARRRSRSCWWLEELRLGTSALYVVCVPRGCPMCVCSLIHTVQEGNSPAREARLHGCVRCGVWVLTPIQWTNVVACVQLPRDRRVCRGSSPPCTLACRPHVLCTLTSPPMYLACVTQAAEAEYYRKQARQPLLSLLSLLAHGRCAPTATTPPAHGYAGAAGGASLGPAQAAPPVAPPPAQGSATAAPTLSAPPAMATSSPAMATSSPAMATSSPAMAAPASDAEPRRAKRPRRR